MGDLADLPRDVRQTIRADERKIAELGIEVTVLPWSEYTGTAGKLIASQNVRKGMPGITIAASLFTIGIVNLTLAKRRPPPDA